MAAFQYLNKAEKKEGEKLCRDDCNATSGNDFKLKEGRYRLDIRKKFCTMRVVKNWKRLPRVHPTMVVDALFLETFTVC